MHRVAIEPDRERQRENFERVAADRDQPLAT
jgi:hypothetical protein